MTSRTLAVVSAGLSQPSSSRLLADQLEAATVRDLRTRGIVPTSRVIELRDHAHDLTNRLLTGFAGTNLGEVLDAVANADGLIVVTPIFNTSYNGLFKTFIDVLDAEALVDKPVLIAATGGTARHSLSLEHSIRPLFAHLRSIVVPTAVFAATEDWGVTGREGAALRDRIDRAGREFAAAVNDRIRSSPRRPDSFGTLQPFEHMLASR